ncbi:hypothetical protein SPAB_05565 [Salmonella enterica subsp. enterica serovar Paratyphi B str. SPB7]|uniref:Uncharacterized protein n=1 Tax=Salmonella paratyphi B (strain ATCC BAA-1250 / SPB7) TaxID=1016998 RepID=A0A6C6ZAN3_SALPB|nr:hypothetical protein SPAB_05565 [Salmonella enterica subsp. enterica serovar Paratyphi B str. SPB7]
MDSDLMSVCGAELNKKASRRGRLAKYHSTKCYRG